MEVKGNIDEVRYRNEENGYSILVLDVEGDMVICTGIAPPVSEGEVITAVGEFIIHPKFGKQLKASNIRVASPESEDEIIRYLGSGIIKGVGPKTAYSIVNTFGERTMKVLECSPHELACIKGISKNKAFEIGKNFMDIKAMRDTIMFLQSRNISLNMALKIYKEYGSDTEAKIRTNPYKLVEDIDGIGFLTADRIAMESGLEKTSGFRIDAGIIYTLKQGAEKGGNTYLPKDLLTSFTQKLLDLDESLIVSRIEDLILTRRVRLVDEENDGVMLSSIYRIEKYAGNLLAQMQLLANAVTIDASSEIEHFEKIENIRLHEMQKDAVASAVNNGVSVITGGPGTGKTTIIKCILSILKARGNNVMLMAPTGRASKRISESTGESASTIHRAILSGESDKLSCDAVIIDEVSMVDIFLLNSLLGKLRPETRLIFVGDKDQLPSVGAGNVLADIMSSGAFNVSSLTQVYRQDDQSMIVKNAHEINAGIMPNLSHKSSDFFYIGAVEPYAIAEKVVGLISSRLPKYLECEPCKIQILCPMKRGDAGTLALNKNLASKINNNPNNYKQIMVGEQIFRVGDKVMHISNNYNLEWKRRVGYMTEEGEGVFNGEGGYITDINKQTGEVTVLFEDGRECVYTQDLLTQLILSYAITVHKSQGSEFDAVVIPIVSGSPMINTRNLLYTAITRAKKLVVLVGEEKVIKRMIDNNYVAERYSYLKQFINQSMTENQILFGESAEQI